MPRYSLDAGRQLARLRADIRAVNSGAMARQYEAGEAWLADWGNPVKRRAYLDAIRTRLADATR